MSEARPPNRDACPRMGRVNEMCQEWMIREDNAMAYQLQNQEITDHYKGNKQRNQLVREDFPHAKEEQLKEQKMAEQAAAVYQRMLAEQEEMDNMIAKQLAKKLELEERAKRRHHDALEQQSVNKMLQQEQMQRKIHKQPYKLPPKDPLSTILDNVNFDLPPNLPTPQFNQSRRPRNHDNTQTQNRSLDTIEHSVTDGASVCQRPVDPLLEEERLNQEIADAEFARLLQEQEGNLEETILQRDRLLAIEAQDKELAKILQERERVKARKAKERAKQKALAKKQQKEIPALPTADQLLPEDSYSNPIDLLPHHRDHLSLGLPNPKAGPSLAHAQTFYSEQEDNYSLPVDSTSALSEPNATGVDVLQGSLSLNDRAIRPSQLNIRHPLNPKPRFPDPEEMATSTMNQHTLSNIAMAIDPTYPKYDNNTSSLRSSPAKSLTPISTPSSALISSSTIEDSEIDEDAPPYMPIQGQRRTASLEKKNKKKNRDGGCKQQ